MRPVSGAPWPTAETQLLVLLGWPARYSLSPVIHNAALREQRLDFVYVVLPTRSEDLPGVVDALGAIGVVGANVTVPHKLAVMPACDHLTAEAELVGAVNTLIWTADGLVGDNTDASGLQDALTADVNVAPRDRFVVLGTGGAARAVAVAVGRLGAELAVVGRRGRAAEEIASLAERAGSPAQTAVRLDDDAQVRRHLAEARVVINATPLGLAGERLPDPFLELHVGQIAYDLVYEPPHTPFLEAAAHVGVETHHGIGMLIGQAAASYRRWTGREAPLATMSAAALEMLAARARSDGRSSNTRGHRT